MKKSFLTILCYGGLSLIACAGMIWPQPALADPSSDNYALDGYSIGGSGSTDDMGSASFNMYGSLGLSDTLNGSSTNYTFDGGLLYGIQSPTPRTPTLSNPHNFYDRLVATLDPADDLPGINYALALSNDDFATVKYVSDQGTLKNQLEASDFRSYDDWGAADGVVVIGLEHDTEYKLKAASSQAGYDQSEFSQESMAETEAPTLSFTVDGNANMGNWNEDNAYSSTAVSTLTTSTNAHNGYSVYAFATQPLTRQNGSETIANYAGTYANPASWLSGLGFGYTTNDTSVSGTAKWNPTTCPGDGGPPLCYAAFSQSAPGDVVVDHNDPLNDGPIEDQQFELTYKVVTQASQTAGVYGTAIVYTIVPLY